MRILVRFYAAGLGTGWFPVAPGTVGSALGVALYWLVRGFPAGWTWLLWLLVTLLGVGAAHTAPAPGEHDPGWVVIDEISGQWLTLLLAGGVTWSWLLAGFLLFRLLDIWKPWLIDRVQSLPGGWGIMADDLLAGLAGGLLLLVVRLWGGWGI